MEKNIIHIEDLTMAYNDKPVLWDIDADIMENSRTAIIGPNGAGKSTLLKGILNLMKLVSGEITIMGKKYREVYKQIAYIPQINTVNWNFPATVEDVVLMGRYAHLGWIRRPSKTDKEISKEALIKMEMNDYAKRQISQLSGGQRQRVFLARAIAQDAKIYLMDEPLQGVDIKTEGIIMSVIKEFQSIGKTVIVVHHDLSTVEKYFDHIILLNKILIAQGKVSDAFNKETISKAYSFDGSVKDELINI